MNLTRNNYEQFFLLYADNELTGAEREKVELFLEDNPDLREEMNMLLDLRLSPEMQIVFEKKDLLFAESLEQAAKAEAKLEEQLLLYVDGELNDQEREAVEALRHLKPAVGENLDLLLETRLQPDLSIVFEEKSSLYRKAPSARRMTLSWMAAAAAAMVLAVALWLLFRIPSDRVVRVGADDNKENVAGAHVKPSSKATLPVVTSLPSSALQNGNKAKQTDISSPEGRASNEAVTRNKVVSPASLRTKQQLARSAEPPEEIGSFSGARFAYLKPAQPAGTKSDFSPSDGLGVSIGERSASKEWVAANNGSPLAKGAVDSSMRSSGLSDLAVNTEDEIGFMASTSRKTNMRGLFRKVSRVFDKITNGDDENRPGLQLGNFQIALK